MSGKHAVAFATKPSARSRRASSQPTPGPGAPPGPGLVRPTASPILKDVGLFIALAAIYFVAGKLGLRLAFVHVSATTVWPPTGIALAAFLLLGLRDRKSTRLNSSHSSNPYAVFCLIKKNTSIIHKKLFQFYSFIYLNVVKVHLFHL